jgi:hypothetical protein
MSYLRGPTQKAEREHFWKNFAKKSEITPFRLGQIMMY